MAKKDVTRGQEAGQLPREENEGIEELPQRWSAQREGGFGASV